MIALSHLLLCVVLDCDGTLVHYDDINLVGIQELQDSSFDKKIALPASSGSGRKGYVSRKTLSLLNSINQTDVIVVCATGMRMSTMIQRQPFFPTIKYWLCENGGRIFRVDEDRKLTELESWSTVTTSNTKSIGDLQKLSEELQAQGAVVDNSYLTMIRVKCMDLNDVLRLLPPTLKATVNLGYVDIHLPHSGKLNAVKWLMSYISYENGENEEESTRKLYFMGDDDNDIEIADAADIAFIMQPCSENMRRYVNLKADTASYHSPDAVDDVNTSNILKPSHIILAENSGMDATNELLLKILQRITES